jgi:natural product biosynthesis luciferase-like monooxygenase protein
MNNFNFSTLVALLQNRALHQPRQKIFTFLRDGEIEEENLIYQELDQQCRAIAAYLQSLDMKGERALLLYPPGLKFIAAFFGCLYAGVVAVPAYPPRPNQSLSRLQAIGADAEAKIALTTTTVLGNVERQLAQSGDLQHLYWLATDNINSDNALAWQEPDINRETLAFLQYTSGSTGTPKGVMISHGNLLHNSEYIKQAFELTPDTVSVTWLPSFHDMGLIDGIIQPLYTGFLGILMPPISFLQRPIRWLTAISRYRATHCGGPNFAYELCVSKITPEQQETLNLSSWCSAYNGAEPIRRETLERFAAKFKPCGFQARFFYPCYGMAESTLMASGGSVKDEPIYCTVEAQALEQNRVVEASSDTQNMRHLVGSGHSWLQTKIVIANPELLTQCAPHQVGEIWVSGSSVAQGYWRLPEKTKTTFGAYLADTGEGPFLRTGDLGFLKDGELFVTGRLKDLIIIRGRNYYPQDIELTVEQCHPALRPTCSAAFAVEVENSEQLVVACEVERNYLRRLNVNEVIEAIRSAVSEQHELQVYAVLLLKTGSIPKTSSGKIQRHACRAEFLAGTLNTVNSVIDSQPKTHVVSKEMQFSLLYFSSNETEFTGEKYKLFLEGAKFADQNGFTAIWTPERHFHAFGGLYPNPSVLSAALASITERIRLRAGSVVLPLHNPIRVAEEWSVVDNLSQGRVDIAFARGWNPNDFVLSPDTYANSKEIMFSGIQTLQKLWRGEIISLPNGVGKETNIKIYPLPKQRELSIWITCTDGKERFIEAGSAGFNILTALLFQPIEELAEKIALYREARAKHGYNPDSGQVTLMLHTCVGEDMEVVRNQVREPFIEYLKSSVNLWRNGSKNLDELSVSQQEKLLAYAFERYFHTSTLFGTPNTCLEMVRRLQEIGVDEIACLIDFGINADTVLANLNSLNTLRKLANGANEGSKGQTSPEAIHRQFIAETEQHQLLSRDSDKRTKVNVSNQSNDATVNDDSPLHVPSNQTKLETPSRQTEPQVAPKLLLSWVQETIVQQIAKSLGKKPNQVSLNKNFYSLGIDSLKAVEIIEALATNFDISVSPTLLFEYPTPAEIAKYLVQMHKAKLEAYMLEDVWKV